MNRSRENRWLHRFAVLTAISTLLLIGLGGLVTSHGVGMAVPDWPTTYGYNMFLFPVSYWVGGVFYEHTHRLFASYVGLLTTVLAVWLWMKEDRRWLRWLGVAAFIAVVFQGVLGGLRVTLFKDQIGIFHGVLAQLFLILTFAIVLFTSRWWRSLPPKIPGVLSRGFRYLLLGVTALVFAQLILGAAMRHQHAGLAVPDFPLAYGKVWPPSDAEFLLQVNRERLDARDYNPVTAGHIHLHMAHRAGAALILIGVAAVAWQSRRQGARMFVSGSMVWLGLTLGQGALGAWTVWSNKAADVATLHVVVGAVILVWGAVLTIISFRYDRGRSASREKSATTSGNISLGNEEIIRPLLRPQ